MKKERTVSSLLPSCSSTNRMCVAVTNADMNLSLNLSTTCKDGVPCFLGRGRRSESTERGQQFLGSGAAAE